MAGVTLKILLPGGDAKGLRGAVGRNKTLSLWT